MAGLTSNDKRIRKATAEDSIIQLSAQRDMILCDKSLTRSQRGQRVRRISEQIDKFQSQISHPFDPFCGIVRQSESARMRALRMQSGGTE